MARLGFVAHKTNAYTKGESGVETDQVVPLGNVRITVMVFWGPEKSCFKSSLLYSAFNNVVCKRYPLSLSNTL